LPLRDVRQWVFIDECGVTTDLLRRHENESARPSLERSRPLWPRRGDAPTRGLTAPAVFDGPIDNASFLGYVEEVLVPTLRRGDVVVLDNLAVHLGLAVHAAIAASGASNRLLPPYSPDFNPVEQARLPS
jgi:hypothetical protein